jgi:DNA-binding GntR family transcriptional regulator
MTRQDLIAVTLEISRALVEAADNVHIHLLFNSVIRLAEGFRSLFELPARVDLRVQDYFERLVETFEARDSEMAKLLTRRVFESLMSAAFVNEWDRQ